MKITLRPATESDLPRILEIYNHYVLHSTSTFDTEPKTLEDRRKWLLERGGRYPVCVAVEGNGNENESILGWGSLSPWSDRLGYRITTEPSLYVDDKFQGKGAGREIIRWLMDEAARIGFHSAISRIADANETSIRLHENNGFKKIGHLHEVGEKFGKLIDVLLYQRIF